MLVRVSLRVCVCVCVGVGGLSTFRAVVGVEFWPWFEFLVLDFALRVSGLDVSGHGLGHRAPDLLLLRTRLSLRAVGRLSEMAPVVWENW